MKSLKINTLWMVMLVMLISATGTLAQNSGERQDTRGKRVRMEQRSPKGPMIPDLTEEQQAKMKEIRLETQKQKLPIENELREKKARMNTLSTVENPDMKAINKLIDEMGGLKTKMEKIQAAQHQEVRKQLTEEQRVIFDSRSARHGQKRMKGEQHRRREFSGK